MKRLITASLLFVFIFIVCLFENLYIEKFFNETESNLNTIKNSFLTDSTIEGSKFEQLIEKWEQNKNLLTAFVNREQINDIFDEISLLEYKYLYNTDEFLISTNRIILRLGEIKSYEKMNFYGLL